MPWLRPTLPPAAAAFSRLASMPATISTSRAKDPAAQTVTRASAADAQVRQALDNVRAILEAAGLTLEHVVYVQVYLTDIGSYSQRESRLRRILPEDSTRSSGPRRLRPS